MDYTRNEKIMRITALIYAVAFLVTGLIFIFLPDMLLGIINSISASLFPMLQPAADSGKFWLSMTVSMMAAITVMSFMIYRDVKTNYAMAVPLVAAKFTSSLMGFAFFIIGIAKSGTGWNTLANLVIMITDFPLGCLMLILYLRVSYEKR